jgi:hypothetical protein
MALGIRPEVSALVMKGTLASRETLADTDWGSEPILYASPVFGAGCSGCPVFLTQDEPTDVRIAGMCVGMVFDNTGVKLSKLIPAHVIHEACVSAVKPSE